MNTPRTTAPKFNPGWLDAERADCAREIELLREVMQLIPARSDWTEMVHARIEFLDHKNAVIGGKE